MYWGSGRARRKKGLRLLFPPHFFCALPIPLRLPRPLQQNRAQSRLHPAADLANHVTCSFSALHWQRWSELYDTTLHGQLSFRDAKVLISLVRHLTHESQLWLWRWDTRSQCEYVHTGIFFLHCCCFRRQVCVIYSYIISSWSIRSPVQTSILSWLCNQPAISKYT